LGEKSNILLDMVFSSFLRFIRITFPISNCPTRISKYFLGFIAGRLTVFEILEDYRGYQKFDEVWQAYKELKAEGSLPTE